MIKLYNTLTRKKEEFLPIKKGQVGVYSCGPTVYGNQHIGNMYAYIQWDILTRFLHASGYKVKWVMNITDVGHLTGDNLGDADQGEDKMEKGAKKEGLSVWEVAKKYTNQFLGSLEDLNIKMPDVLCKATDHIKEQIDFIKKIEKNGFTYKTKTGLVFDTSKFKDYKKFARLNLNKQFSGARTEIDAEKKQTWDFLLWVTNQPNHIMQWDSPWGRGFPGWHIECSAMAKKYLGEKFDIHTGGNEHISVHHTNEIAQSFGAFGISPAPANYWLHNGWLLLNKEKISKSLGNIILTTDFKKKGFDPLTFRYLTLTSHYKKGLNFTWNGLEASQKALNTLREKTTEFKNSPAKNKKTAQSVSSKKYEEMFYGYLGDDLNTPKSLALIWDLLKDKNVENDEKGKLIINFDKVLGLNLNVKKTKNKSDKIPTGIIELVKKREQYRKEKNWKKSDEIRGETGAMGYEIEDTPEGPIIKKI